MFCVMPCTVLSKFDREMVLEYCTYRVHHPVTDIKVEVRHLVKAPIKTLLVYLGFLERMSWEEVIIGDLPDRSTLPALEHVEPAVYEGWNDVRTCVEKYFHVQGWRIRLEIPRSNSN